MSQRELSFPGCTSAYVSRIESGHRVPSLQVIHEFARRLHVSPVFLATGVHEDTANELLDAEVALRLGDLAEAGKIYRKRLAEDPGHSAALSGLGIIAFRENHMVKAITLLEQVVESEDELLNVAGAVETLARSYALSASLEAAIALLERALAEAEEKNALVEILRFRVLLANALVDNTQFERAEQVLAQALGSASELDDPLAMARVYWSQARLHTHHRNPQVGIRYARRAIEILERTENDAYVATAYHLLAYAQIEAGKPESALRQLARGRELFADSLTGRDDAKFSLEETRALLALQRPKQAAKKAAQVLTNIEALDPLERGRAYMLLGDVFRASGDPERAVELYKFAIELLEEGGRAYLIEAGERLAELLEELGQPAQALAVLKRAVSSRRSPAIVSSETELTRGPARTAKSHRRA
jgi:tetratricopeptide (TPR) repeat protein